MMYFNNTPHWLQFEKYCIILQGKIQFPLITACTMDYYYLL